MVRLQPIELLVRKNYLLLYTSTLIRPHGTVQIMCKIQRSVSTSHLSTAPSSPSPFSCSHAPPPSPTLISPYHARHRCRTRLPLLAIVDPSRRHSIPTPRDPLRHAAASAAAPSAVFAPRPLQPIPHLASQLLRPRFTRRLLTLATACSSDLARFTLPPTLAA